MPTQDRTQEFKSCVTSQAKLNAASARSQLVSRQNSQDAVRSSSPKSEFALRASAIAKDIGETTAMLQRLAMLAKRKTLFDDRPVEITELTYVIKQKVSAINSQIAGLQNSVKNSSTANGWGAKKGDNQINEHSKNVVVLLQGQLTQVTTGFAEVLETRTKNIQASKSRTEQFISSSASSAKDPLVADSPLYQQKPMRGPSQEGDRLAENPYSAAFENSSDPYKNSGAGGDYLALPEQQQTMALLEEQQDQYLSSRNTAVEAIESTMQELGNIFSQLSTMVAEQRDVVQRIDANTEDVALNVSGAQRELLKYYATISSNRWLMVKIFSIVIVFFLLWVVVS